KAILFAFMFHQVKIRFFNQRRLLQRCPAIMRTSVTCDLQDAFNVNACYCQTQYGSSAAQSAITPNMNPTFKD
ncbi:MAG: hypothetical protein CO013_01880, partial [Syntrophobacterales bacterium CG_4_8_14_3_um_filter_58_8]